MKPPIASPHVEERPIAPITKRIEWDDERECFVLRYRFSFRGRMRGEMHLGMQSLWTMLNIPLGAPIVAFSLIIATLAQRYKKPAEFSIFEWGIEYTATEAAYRTSWKNLGQPFVHKEDFFVLLQSFLGGGYCLPRESFADESEALRLLQMIELLKARNGANWEAVKSQFQT